ncbi:hypothetical protein ABPG74_013450 [Tetrahymena malaccensis]
MNNLKKSNLFKSVFGLYYVEIFWVAFRSFHRNFTLSLVLMVVKKLQQLAIALVNDGTQMVDIQSDQLQLFQRFISFTSIYRFFTLLLDKNTAQDIAFTSLLSINLFLFIYCLGLLIYSPFIKYDHLKIKRITLIPSILFSVYNYLFYLPSIEVTTVMLSSQISLSTHILCYLNFSLTWGIATLQATHDYDYSFEDTDQLSKAFSRVDIFSELVTGLFCFVSQKIKQQYSLMIFLFLSLLKIGAFFYRKKYYSQFFSLMHIQFTCFQFLICLTVFSNLKNSQNSFALLGLIIIPISFKLGIQIKKFIEQNIHRKSICCEDHFLLSPQQLDTFIRQICQNLNFFYEDYMEYKQGVFFESLFINHKNQCAKNNPQKFCFCQRFAPDLFNSHFQDRNIEGILGQESRKQFVLNYIIYLYQIYLNKADYFHKKYIVFSYLSFLIEKAKNKTKVFQELLKIQQEQIKHKDWSNLIFTKNLINKANALNNEYIFDSTNENQRIKMYEVITFDNLISEFQNSLRSQIEQQIQYYKYLCSDYFILEELMSISQTNLTSIQHISSIKKQLFDINPNDPTLIALSYIFQFSLDFYNSPNSKSNQKQQQKQNKILFNNISDVFSPSSCSIYCSLISQSIDIKRASKNFQQIFEIEPTSVIGKQVSNLVPKALFDAHELTIDEFINFGGNHSIINKGERFAFAQNRNGFVFPISIRIKTENFQDDFGITALIKKVDDSKHYIFFNESYQIADISSFIYEKIFSQEYSLNQLKNQKIIDFLPLLDAIVNDQTLSEDNYYNSCFIVKRRKEYKQEIKIQQSNCSLKQNIHINVRVFSAIFRIRNLQSKHMKHFKYLEFETFSQEKTLLGKQAQLNLLSRCLNADFQICDDQIKESLEERLSEYQQLQSTKENFILKQESDKVIENYQNQEQFAFAEIATNTNYGQQNQTYQYTYDLEQNINIGGLEDAISSRRKNSSEKFYLSNQDSNQPQQDLNCEIISSRQEINNTQRISSKQEINNTQLQITLSNRYQNHQTHANFSNMNYLACQAHQNLKQINLLRTGLQQKHVLNRHSIQTLLDSNKNYVPSSLKFAICDINQVLADKLLDSPQSITLNPKNNKNKEFENIKEEELSSNDCEQQIRKFYSQNNSNRCFDKQQNNNCSKIFYDVDKYSINGNQSSQISIRKIIIRKITQNTNSGIIKMIIFTGLSSIIFLSACVLTFYFMNLGCLNKLSDLFNKFNSATIINQSIFQYAKEEEFQINLSIFKDVLKLNRVTSHPSNINQNITELAFLQSMSKNNSKRAIVQFSKSIKKMLQTKNEEFFDYIQETQIPVLSEYADLKIYTRSFTNHSILYSMLLVQSSLNQLYLQGQTKHQELYPQSIVFGNIKVLSIAIQKIQGMISKELAQSYEELKDIQIIQLIQISISALCLIIIAVPFMIYFKSQQYQILKLLGTFPPSLLQQYINQFTTYLNHLKQFQKNEIEQKLLYNSSFNILQSMKSLSTKKLIRVSDSEQRIQNGNKKNNQQSSQNNIQNVIFDKQIKQITKRQRQIASFSEPKPFKTKYILFSLLTISPYMVYPLFNLISVNSFVDEFLATLNQRETLLTSSQFILQFQVIHFKIWEMVQRQPTFSKNFFYQYGVDIFQQTENVLNDIKNLTIYETSQRYDQSQRQIYFDSFLLGNICDNIELINNKTVENPFLKSHATRQQCEVLLSVHSIYYSSVHNTDGFSNGVDISSYLCSMVVSLQKIQKTNQLDKAAFNQLKYRNDYLKLDYFFYIEIFWIAFKSFQRNFSLSIVLIVIRQLQEIAIAFQNHGTQLAELQQDQLNYFKYLVQWSSAYRFIELVIDENYAQNFILAFAFGINLFIIASLIFLLIYSPFIQYDKSKVSRMGQILSFLFSVYNYVLFLPSLECTTIILSSGSSSSSILILCYFNFLFTWGIGLLQATHDYDYSFDGSDQLSQDFARTDVFNEIIAGIYCSFSQITLQKYSLIFSFFFSAFKIVTYFKRKKYYHHLFSLIYIQFSCFQLVLSMIALSSILKPVNSLAFLVLAFAPVSAKIGQQIKKIVVDKNYQKNICREDLSDLSPHQFDSFIRLICQNSNFFYEDYIQNQQGVFFENLYVNHISKCIQKKSSQNCFCSRFTPDQQNGEPLERYIKDIIGQEFRKEFILHYILNLYNNYINKVEAFKRKYIILSYLSFLIEKVQNVTKSFQELLRIQQEYSKHKDYTNLFCIQVLMERSSKLYKQYTMNQVTQNQKINMHDPIAFDYFMVEFQSNLKSQIQKQIEYFKYLCSDCFNLEELMAVSMNNLIGIKNIKMLQQQLYDIHPNDQALNSLSTVFQLTLDFYSVSPKVLKQKSAQKQYKNQLISQIDVFSSDSCSIYCSLINKNIEISRISSNFSSIFEMDQISVLGKQISNLLPKMLYQLHEITIDDFISMGNVGSILSAGQRHVFAQDGNGFVFPVDLSIKMENFQEDFGVTSLVTRVRDSKQYIFFDELFQISEISSFIYQQIFSQEYTLNQLKNQVIFNFIPLLQALLNDSSLLEENYYNTCLLLRKKQETQCDLKSTKDNRKQSLYQNETIFSLIFKIKSLQSKHMKHIKYLEIIKFSEEKSFQGRKYQLNLLSKCLNIEFQYQEESQKETQEQIYEFQIASLIQDDNGQKQILNKVADCQTVEQEQISNLKIDSRVDVDIQSQFNIYEQLSNTNINAIKSSEDEIIYMKRKISYENYLQNNSTSASKKTPQDQQNQFIFPKYEISSYQQLIHTSNKFLTPLSSSNLNNTTNYPNNILTTLEKIQEKSKVKNSQRSVQSLFQNQFLLKQSMGNNNLQNASLKYAICDFNQMIVDKWFDSPSSIVLYHQNYDNKEIENNRAQDDCSIKDQKHIQNQLYNENSSDTSIKGESKQNQLMDDQQQSAFTGSQNTQISTKKIMIKKITKNTDTGITKVIAFTGFLSVIALYASVLTFYFININNIKLISDLFNKFSTANIINEGTFWFTREQQFALDSLIFAQVLGIDKPIVDPYDPSKQTTLLYQIFEMSQIQQQKAVQDFSQNINSILHSYNEKFFDYISQTQISTYSDYIDKQIYTHVYKNNSILYTMMLFQSSLNQLYLKGYYQELYPQSVIYGNIQVFSDAILKIQDMIHAQLFEQYKQLQDNQIEQLIQTLVSAFLLIIIAVPFLIYFKQQQYQTIKLLGSFPPSLLQQYIGLFNYYLNRIELYQRKEIEQIQQYQSYNALQSMRSISVKQISGVFDVQKSRQDNSDNSASKKIIKKINKKKNQSKRQRQIASFSKAKPFKFKYVFISLLVVCPFMIYPIFNLITANLFVEEALDTLDQRNIILSSSQFILNFEVVHYKIWEIALSKLLFKNIFFYNYGLNITKQSQGVLQGVKNLTNFETSSRYDSSERQLYFNSLLLDSSCTYIDKMRNNTISNPYLQTNFTGDQCRKLLSGSFDRGYVLAFQYLTNTYQDWFSTYQEYAALQTPQKPLFQNISQSIVSIQLQNNNILDIYQSNLLLQQISTSFEKFFEAQNDKYTKYIINMFTILMIFQLVLIFLAISIIWTSLYKKFKKEINDTRLLLTNVHIDMILENKLIQQYLKRK